MTTCNRMIDVDALIDGEAGDTAADIERHIEGCAPCRAYLADARRNDAALRRAASARLPDTALEQRLFGVETAPPTQHTRRKALAGLGIAAGIGGLGLIFGPTFSRQAYAGADFREAVLGDYATGIAADRPLDITATEPAHVMPWIAARVPFVLPQRVAPEGTQLRGCRLCWLVGRRLAAFSIDAEQTNLGLYIAGAEGLSGLPGEGTAPVMAGRGGVQGAFWRDRGLALGIVGAAPAPRLATLARSLQG